MSLGTIARQLVQSANPEDLVKASFQNYHVEGMDYLCLLRTPRLTIKAYLFREGLRGTGYKNWIVWPHNHRYAFEHLTVCGDIRNVTFPPGASLTEDVFVYAYTGANKNGGVQVIGESILNSPLEDGRDAFKMLDPFELHTLAVRGPAIGIQAQYHDTREASMMVAPKQAKVICAENENLYRAASVGLVENWLDTLRQALT